MSLERNNLVGLSVETQGGIYLGRVSKVEYAPGVETQDFASLQYIHVRPNSLKRLLNKKFIIHKSQIIKITEEKVVVDDAVVLQKKELKLKTAVPLSE